MPLITVPEYAKRQGVSVQAIYQQIKRDSIKYTEQDGIKYIEVPGKPKKRKNKGKCKHLKREIKYLNKQIKRIIKDKDQQYRQLEKLFDKLLRINTPMIPEVIDAKIIKKKKK